MNAPIVYPAKHAARAAKRDAASGRPRGVVRRGIERFGYAGVLMLNVVALVVLHRVGALTEWAIVGVHLANVAGLAALEFASPMNPDWLLIRGGRVRWSLLAKTYLWYLFDSRVWFRVHGVLVAAVGVWIAQRFSLEATSAPTWLQFVGFALFIDFARYWIHRGQHSLAFLWRWHAMHHTPTNLTPVRAWWTHPVDDVILYSLEIVLMVTLGLEPVVVLAYVSIDNTFQLLNHANVRLSSRGIGEVLQHPRYHLLHHRRILEGERTVNFGEMFTVWDRLFGTFEARAFDEMERMELGLTHKRRRTLWHQLSAPFYRRVEDL